MGREHEEFHIDLSKLWLLKKLIYPCCIISQLYQSEIPLTLSSKDRDELDKVMTSIESIMTSAH